MGWRASKREEAKKKKEREVGASTAITVNAPTIYYGCGVRTKSTAKVGHIP